MESRVWWRGTRTGPSTLKPLSVDTKSKVTQRESYKCNPYLTWVYEGEFIISLDQWLPRVPNQIPIPVIFNNLTEGE